MMKSALFVCAALSCVIVTSPTLALNCDTVVTQSDLNECARSNFNAADAALNIQYMQARFSLIELGDGGKALLEAHRAWFKFRSSACEAEAAPFASSSVHPQKVNECLARLTWRRTEDLQNISKLN